MSACLQVPCTAAGMQVRWFQGQDTLSNKLKLTLRSMPIFEEAQPASAGSSGEPCFLDLLDQRQLAPTGTPLEILPGSNFERAHSEAEARILVDHLGVRQLTRTEVLQQHVFHRCAKFSWFCM